MANLEVKTGKWAHIWYNGWFKAEGKTKFGRGGRRTRKARRSRQGISQPLPFDAAARHEACMFRLSLAQHPSKESK